MTIKISDANSASKSKNTLTRVHFILDESGSMSRCRLSTIDGFNEYINGLKNDKNGNKYVVSLTKFEGGNIVRVFTDTPVKKVPELTTDTYRPCGMTNLNDAVGSTMQSMEQKPLKGKKKYNTLVIIMTDGYENASREWTKDSVASLIKRKEDTDGWTVTFLGADIDTQAVSSAYNIKVDNARSYSKMGMGNTMRGLSQATVAYAATSSVGENMGNMLHESVSGMTEEDWLKVDDDVDNADKAILAQYNTVAATVTPPQPDLSNVGIIKTNPDGTLDIQGFGYTAPSSDDEEEDKDNV